MSFKTYLKTFLIISFSFKIIAYQNDLAMKAGFALAINSFNTLQDEGDIKDETNSYGAYTTFSYRFKRSEVGLDSRITLGKATDLDFEFEGNTITGSGNIRLVDITPYFRYSTKDFKFPKFVERLISDINRNSWVAYAKLGPSWVIQTLDLNSLNLTGTLKQDYKITYESFGANIGIGIEEVTLFKETNPVFIEVNASAFESYKVSLVDKSNSREINILSERDADQEIKTFQLAFIIGVTLF